MSVFSAIFSVVLLLAVSHAGAKPPDLSWNDAEGFTPLRDCRVAPTVDLPLRVVDSFSGRGETLVSPANPSLLKDRSLVQLSASAPQATLQAVKVIAPPARQGYVRRSSLQSLDNYVLEIKPLSSRAQEALLKAGLAGTFWQASFENERPLIFQCRRGNLMTELFIFEVFVADQEDPVARVGVDLKNIALFAGARVHSAEEADEVLDSRMSRPPETHRQSLTVGTGSARFNPASPLETVRGTAPVQDLAAATVPSNPAKKTSLPVPSPKSAEKELTIESIIQDIDSGAANDADETDEEEADEMIDSELEHVVCINEATLSVRDESLENILFRAERNETVLPVQSWDEKDAKKKTINGTEYTFIKVQFPERSGTNTGWLAQEYIRLEGKCPVPKDDTDDDAVATPALQGGVIKNISSSACCEFPTAKRPSQSYLTGMRRFKAGRSKGRRLHAACDLYRVHGEAAVSVAPGKVVKGLYKFYQGTYALEVQHPGGFIARYGELTGKRVSNVGAGKSVKTGQTLGAIGTVNSGCCKPMLHFELYAGTKKGSLSTRGNKFQRRSDLMDPTKHLRKWEKMKFGSGY